MYNFNQRDYLVDPMTGRPMAPPTSSNPMMTAMNTTRANPDPNYIDPNENAAEASRLAELETPWKLPKNLEITEENAVKPKTENPVKGGASAMDWAGAIGNVAGDFTALMGSTGKYDAAQKGKTIVGGVGTVVGGIFGMPQLGGQIGSFIGGTIGGAFDKKHQRTNYDIETTKDFGALKKQPNINPYGYAKEGGLVSAFDYDEPSPNNNSFEEMYMHDDGTPDMVAEAFAKSGVRLGTNRFMAKGGVVNIRPKPYAHLMEEAAFAMCGGKVGKAKRYAAGGAIGDPPFRKPLPKGLPGGYRQASDIQTMGIQPKDVQMTMNQRGADAAAKIPVQQKVSSYTKPIKGTYAQVQQEANRETKLKDYAQNTLGVEYADGDLRTSAYGRFAQNYPRAIQGAENLVDLGLLATDIVGVGETLHGAGTALKAYTRANNIKNIRALKPTSTRSVVRGNISLEGSVNREVNPNFSWDRYNNQGNLENRGTLSPDMMPRLIDPDAGQVQRLEATPFEPRMNPKTWQETFDYGNWAKRNPIEYQDAANWKKRMGDKWLREWTNDPITKERYADVMLPDAPDINIKDAIINSKMADASEHIIARGGTLNKPFTGRDMRAEAAIAHDNMRRLQKGESMISTTGPLEYGSVGEYNYGSNSGAVDMWNPEFIGNRTKRTHRTIQDAVRHEGTHVMTRGTRGLKPEVKKDIQSAFDRERIEVEGLDYLTDPSEVHARIMEIRGALNYTPGTKVTSPMVNDIIKQGYAGRLPVEPQFFDLIKDKKKFKELMNKLPAVVIPAAGAAVASEQFKSGGWIKKAVNPKHKGYCTPMTKSTCTPRRKALARTFKKHHGFHEEGGLINNTMRNPIQELMYEDIPQDEIMYMAEGGYPEGQQMAPEQSAMSGAMDQPQGPQKQLINIESGELLVNPNKRDLPVVRKYVNENRYSAHKKDPMKEPIGNFTMAEEDFVVIPKEYADRYEDGDILTRKSIIAEILKNQANNPGQNAPRTGNSSGAEYAAAGMQVGEDPGPYQYVRGVGWVPNPKVPKQAVNTGGFGPSGLGDNWLSNAAANYRNPTVDNPNMNYGAGNTVTPPTYIDPNEDAAEASRQGDIAMPWKLPKALEITADNVAPRKPVVTTTTPVTTRTKLNRNLIASKVAGAFSTAFGTVQAMGDDPFLRYDENRGFDDAISYAEGIETNPNVTASIGAMNQRSKEFIQQLNNINSPSIRSEAGKIRGELMKGTGEIYQNASNIAMELRNKKRDMLGNLKVNQGANRLDMRQRLMQELRMDQANRQSLVHQGIAEGAMNFQQGVMDEEKLKAINSVAEFYNIDPYSAQMLIDKQNFFPYVQESVNSMERQMGINLRNRAGTTTGTAGRTKGMLPLSTRNGQRFDANNNIVDSKGYIIK